MPDINEIKKQEMGEIVDFYYFIQDYGHIFYDNPSILDSHFSKILEGIADIREIVNENYSR